MDGVGISIIERPRPLHNHDTPNPTHHTYTLKCEEPLKPPDPRRNSGPGRVDHLHHHTPVALSDHPTPRAASTAITGLYVEHQSIWGASYAHQMEALQTDEQITPITTIKRHRAAAGRVRHRPRSLDDSGARSPLIIKDLDLYPQPPTNTRSPTLNSEEPQIRHPYGCHTWLLSRGPKSTTRTRAHHAHEREPSNTRALKRHAL